MVTPSDFAYAVTFIVVGWAIRHSLSRRMASVLAEINNKLTNIMATQAQVAADLTALTEQVTKIKGEVTGKLQELADAIAAQGDASPEVETALAALKAEVKAVDDLVADPVIEDPPLPPADPPAEPPANP